MNDGNEGERDRPRGLPPKPPISVRFDVERYVSGPHAGQPVGFGVTGHPHDLPVPPPSQAPLTEADVRRIVREEIRAASDRRRSW